MKKKTCCEKHKFRFNYFRTCVFHYENIFCKKVKHIIKPNFSKYKIRPPLLIFSVFKKNNNDKIKSKLPKSWNKWTGLKTTTSQYWLKDLTLDHSSIPLTIVSNFFCSSILICLECNLMQEHKKIYAFRKGFNPFCSACPG